MKTRPSILVMRPPEYLAIPGKYWRGGRPSICLLLENNGAEAIRVSVCSWKIMEMRAPEYLSIPGK